MASGRIVDAEEKGGVYTAVISGGEGRPKRPKVIVKSPTDITTHCGCMMNRQTGGLCEHGTAVVLAELTGAGTPADDLSLQKTDGQRVVPSTDGRQVELLLPTGFADLVEHRGILPARWRVVELGKTGLSAALLNLPAEKDAGLLQLSGIEVATVLRMVSDAGAGLRLDGSGKRLRCSSSPMRWPVELSRSGTDDLLLTSEVSTGKKRLLKVANDVYFYDSAAQSLQCVSSGGAEGADTLMQLACDGQMSISINEFLSWADWWAEHFDCQPGLRELGIHVENVPSPHGLKLTGGSRGLILQLEEGVHEGELERLGDDTWQRRVENPLDARRQIASWGFVETSHREAKYELAGEQAVKVFLAHTLEPLMASPDWRWDILPAIDAYREMLEPLTPEFNFHQGEDWTGFDLGFRAPGSDRLNFDQIRKLLGSGRGTVKMRSGKTAVLAADAVEELEEVLRDADVRQDGSGRYEADPRQLLFLRNIAKAGGPEVPTTDAVEQGLGELGQTLRPYQLEGVAFLQSVLDQARGCLLADDMGLGKTLQSLAAIELINARAEKSAPSLVVCPTSLLGNWRAEAAKFFPKWRVSIYHGGGRERDDEADLVITTYALAARDLDELKGVDWRVVLLDEASLIRNARTQAAKAVFQLPAEYRLALSGTPVENSVADLWSIFRFLLPGYLGKEKEFAERYQKPLSKGDAPPALLQRLRARIAPFMLRRVKRDVAKDLPAKIIQIESSEMTDAQSDMYHSLLRDGEQIVAEFAAASGKSGSRMQMLTLLLRLRQAACDPRLLGVQKAAAGGKIERLRELLAEAVAGGHRVLIFSQFTSMLDLIAETLTADGHDFCLLTGATRDRSKEVNRFQKSDGPPVFLISLKAGGYGLTLTQADTVVHFDPWWNPAVEAQATDRAHRIGQTRSVNVYKLVTKGTVEEKIVALQAKKQRVLDATFDEATPMMDGLTDADMLDLVESKG